MPYKITFLDSAKNFGKFLLKGDFTRLSSEEYEQRLAICKACEHYDAKGYLGVGKCTLCGCTRHKLKFKNEHCKKGKF